MVATVVVTVVAMAAVTMVATVVVTMAATVVATVVVTMVATVVATVVATAVATAVAVTVVDTVEAILNLVPLIAINPLVQKVGKIEAMEILWKTLNLKVEEVGEKEEFPTMAIP